MRGVWPRELGREIVWGKCVMRSLERARVLVLGAGEVMQRRRGVLFVVLREMEDVSCPERMRYS